MRIEKCITIPYNIGVGFVFRQFAYHAGEVTEEHKQNDKLKSSPTTQLVSQIVFSGGRTISYEYDAEERITQVDDSVEGITTYTYDALGQLLTETNNGEVVNTMTYDSYGNICTKNGNTYTYGNANWKDLLTSYNGQPITYDAQGNPTSYLGHTLTWEKGRQLKSFDGNTYTYNANGIRTSKTVNGVKHTYILDGTKILRETWNGNTLIPLYDNEDSVCGIVYNNEPFYFQKNLQGDIIAIVDKDAEVVARYSYDDWGACAIRSDSSGCSIATINPFRYRGYYYDNETGLYYLESRYYNPQIGRFINADAFASTGQGFIGNNMFAYCLNNPVNLKDPTGDIAITTIILIGSAIIGAAAAGYTAYKEYQAGYDAVHIVGDSICAGFAGFSIVYSGGMSLYQCYQNYCYLNAITPVTEINITGATQVSTNTVPQAANDTLAYIDKNGRAPQGYKGGKEFVNDGRNGGSVLPKTGMPYREYDIYPYTKGVSRGLERIVVGTDNSAWYTRDHYKTFMRMR